MKSKILRFRFKKVRMCKVMKTEQRKRNYGFLSDTTIKYFMKSKEYCNWFYELIRAKTGIDLSEYELYDNELNTGNKLKDYRMDFLFINKKKDTKVIIEANNSWENGTPELKGYYYLYRMEGNSIKEGEEYQAKFTKLIMFNNYSCKVDESIKISNKLLMDPVHNIIRKDIESWEIYLPKFHEICYDEIESEMDKRLYIMGVGKMEELEKIKQSEKNEQNLRIIQEYERLQKENPEFIWEYEREQDQQRWENTLKNNAIREGLQQGFEQGIAQGIEQGTKQNAIHVAKELISMHLPIEQIVKATKLTKEEIEALM